MITNEDIRAVLLDIRTYLNYQRAVGVDNLPTENVFIKRDQEMTNDSKEKTLNKLRDKMKDCSRCRLSEKRTNLVFGEGNPEAELMFAGEGPGSEEDLQGRPFVGRAGQLLTKIIEAMGLKREEVYIGNVVKCRPPENRNPAPDEIGTCLPFLKDQIKIINPKIIVCLGTFAAQSILQTDEKISKLRGKFFDLDGIKAIPTYHPAFLLRNPNMKRVVWEDMQKVMKELGLKVS